jgi:DNA polymerase V
MDPTKIKDPGSILFFPTGVRAGFPSVADDESGEGLNLNSYLIPHPAATFFIRVVGDSMQGAGIFSGDLLIVDRSLEAVDGKIIVAVLNSEFTVKRLLKREGRLILQAENPAYPSIPIHKESEFQVWGVVTYVIHKT